jgi:two-component system sensor histidine kinase TtrS
MTTRLKICLLIILYIIGSGSVFSVQASSSQSKSINIGVLAKSGKQKCFQMWNPTAQYLMEKIPGTHVQIVCLDFDEVDKAVAEKRVDFTITNPSMYVNLEYKYGSSRISTLKSKLADKSNSQFGGVIFYRADRTDIKKAEDLKGKRFMAVAENSFGGWQVSWRYLKDKGIDPYHDFKKLIFIEQHETVVMAVINGEVDAGCVRTDTLEQMVTEYKINLHDIAVLDPQVQDSEFPFLRTTQLYPEWPLAKTQHTSPELAKKVALAMMQLPDNSIEAFRSQSRGWTIPLDYHEVHECLRQLQFAPYTNYGKITLSQLYQQYKIWILTGVALLLCIFSAIILVLKLNGKLKTALTNLDLEHQQRAQTVADLDEFKLTLDQTLDCVFMFSADDLRFIYVNQGAVEHIGYSREELLSMTPLDFKPDATETEFRSMIAPLIEKTSLSLTYSSTNQRKDGSFVPVEVFMQHITPPHKKSRFVAIVRDITIRLEKEKEREVLRTRLHQEQKLASVGQLAAGIAHEINTPAQYLGSNIDFLQEGFEDISKLIDQFHLLLDAAKKQEFSPELIADTANSLEEADWPYLKEEIPQAIKQSIDGVHQVSSIVLAMKKFSHPGGTEKEPTDLNELIETTLTVSRNEWKYWLEPVLQLDPVLPQIPCMRNEIGQVFLNIFVNAAHSIAEKLETNPEGKKGQLIISSQQKENFAIITVTDSGNGISKENLAKIFDPFFTTKDVGKGTGQGLTIAYDIVTNKHGGTLAVTSEEGIGTTFTITLPVSPVPQKIKKDL